MAWRAIIRFSLDYDIGSKVRNAIAPVLESAGITRTATGTWESTHATPSEAAAQVSSMLGIMANPQQVTGVEHYTRMDHVWIYMDEIEEGPAETEQ